MNRRWSRRLLLKIPADLAAALERTDAPSRVLVAAGRGNRRLGIEATVERLSRRPMLNQSLASEFLAPSPGMRPGLAR